MIKARTVYVPCNFKLMELLEKHAPAFPFNPECFLYLLSIVIGRMAYQEKQDDGAIFVSINAQLLQRRIRNYHQYLKYLVEHSVLDGDNHYIPGKKSKGYKLNDQYFGEGWTPVTITSRSLVRVIPAQQRDRRQMMIDYAYLIKWFNNDLKIDYQGASDCLEKLLENDIRSEIKFSERRYELRRLALQRFRDRNYHLSVDGTSARFHSNLTLLKSELRHFITYNGEQLYCIDIKNSQPFLSTVFLNTAFYEEKGILTMAGLNPRAYKDLRSELVIIRGKIYFYPSIIMLVKPHIEHCVNDLELYSTLVDKGRLYIYFNDQYNQISDRKYDLSDPVQKKKFKQLVLTILYSHNLDHFPAKTLFKKLFPTVHRIFFLIKMHEKNVLPILLQQMESETVLRRVARSLSNNYPEMPLFSIHDSLATTEPYKNIVHDYLKAEFHQTIGLEPSLHLEPWNPSKLSE